MRRFTARAVTRHGGTPAAAAAAAGGWLGGRGALGRAAAPLPWTAARAQGFYAQLKRGGFGKAPIPRAQMEPEPPLADAPWVPSARNITISRWLFGSCAVVGTIVVVGGVTRLTESGLSITEWKPLRGIVPPLTQEQWVEEFERYKTFPEYLQREGGMTLSEFQFIFFWEWFHRVLARSMGLVYGVPLLYFSARGYFKDQRGLQLKLFGLLGLGGLQGAVGWWMVKSGLDHNLIAERKKATVSAYRLSTHLSIALMIYAGMLRVAFGLRVAPVNVHLGPYGPLRMAARVATGSMLLTALTGACTAALDAGLLYCDGFPFMGEGLMPPYYELAVVRPLYRNLFENGTAAQTAHRLLALNTLWSVAALNILARRPQFAKFLTPTMRSALRGVNHAVLVQAALGVATLLTYVSLPVAVAHQANSLALLAVLVRLTAAVGSRGVLL